MARLRRMARPRRYRTVSTKTENEAKRRAITPSTMAVVACLMTGEKEEEVSHLSALDAESKHVNYLNVIFGGATYPEIYRDDPTQSPIPGP